MRRKRMMNNIALVESRSLRQEYISKVEVLDKVGELLTFDGDYASVGMVAGFYDVSYKTIESVVRENKDELAFDGLKILKGEELKNLKTILSDKGLFKHARSLTIIPRRAALRIGMLLRDSEVAKKVRNYLLEVEEKKFSIPAGIINHIKDVNGKCDEFNNGVQMVNYRFMQMESDFMHVKEKVDALYETLCIPKNEKQAFSKLRFNYAQKFNYEGDANQYRKLYDALANWFDIDILKPKGMSKRDYIINARGINLIEEFVNGVLLERIVQNENGFWIDLGGYKCNGVEWQRTMAQFNYSCAYCGRKGVTLYPEHMIPQSQEGTTDCIRNIVPACADCNKDKFGSHVKDWYTKDNVLRTPERVKKIKEHFSKYREE
jgi:5-methylcytosine-specific restriction endonuclease McrA